MMRLFIALPLPVHVEQELGKVIELCKEKRCRVRWVRPENIHLTVRFLGDTEENLMEKISDVISRVAREFQPVMVSVDRIGGFPNLDRPRVIWAGLEDDDNVEILRKLTRQVELAVRKLRFEKEKKGFKPHLTLGRVKDPTSIAELTEYLSTYQFTPLTMTLDRLVLFKSTLTPNGPIYERLYEGVLGDKD